MSLDVHPIVDELTAARHGDDSMKAATMTFAVFFENEAVASWVTEMARRVLETWRTKADELPFTTSERARLEQHFRRVPLGRGL